jgi:shikimate dehydrogenase
MTTHVRRCGVLGDPIAHSLSPVLHRAGYAALGLSWEYDAYRVPSGGLAAFLTGLDESWRGLSLTMPLKREAMALVDSRSAVALLAGAANTLVLEGGQVHADNTDVPGARAAVRERYDGPVSAVTVLGGGATAVSTSLALCDLGAREVTLLVRSADRGAAAAALVRAHPSAPTVTVGSLADDRAAGEVLVSTVPAQAQGIDVVARCSDVPVVFDVVYDPWPTPLAAACRGVVVSGAAMLLHQAAAQVELMTGRDAPLDAMRKALATPR